MKNKIKDFIVFVTIIAGIGFLLFIGNHFEVLDLKSLLDNVNIRLDGFGWATFGTTLLIIVFKVIATFVIDTLQNKKDNDNYNTDKVEKSNQVIIEQNNMIINNQNIIIERQEAKDKAINELSYVPESIKEAVNKVKEKYNTKNLVEDIKSDALETVGDIVEIGLDKALDIAKDFIEKV